MIQIPANIQNRYKAFLIKKAIPEKYHFHYMKWLRYYLDFCLKYKCNQSDKKSLSHFLSKLQEKNQTEQQQEQASDAISIYYESAATHSDENIPFKNNNAVISTKKEGLKSTITRKTSGLKFAPERVLFLSQSSQSYRVFDQNP